MTEMTTTQRPACRGKWVSGSGGHRIHESCDSLADWWHPSDAYAYCEEHITDFEKPKYLRWEEQDYRKYTWSFHFVGCQEYRNCDSDNGSWSSPDRTLKKFKMSAPGFQKDYSLGPLCGRSLLESLLPIRVKNPVRWLALTG